MIQPDLGNVDYDLRMAEMAWNTFGKNRLAD
jgi:hypothetical protein